MPNYRIPRGSSQHRIAAIALYRALLTQCRAIPFADQQGLELQNVVRNRFKQAQHVHSLRRLRVAFEAGYEAIDHLDAAVAGNEESKSYILSLLERAPAKIKAAPVLKHVTTETPPLHDGRDSNDAPQQPRLSLFDRPLPLEQLSGKRHVPVLFNANHVPILRLTKPQPESLSRYIRQRLIQRDERHRRRMRLLDERVLASKEDEWDHLVESSKSLGYAMNPEPKWADATSEAIWEVSRQLNDERAKNQAMALKMQGVVDREQELFDKERAERKAAKQKERLFRKQAATSPTEVHDTG